MSVVLIGTDEKGIAVVGIYESIDHARHSVHLGKVPRGFHYAAFTPEMNSFVERRRYELVDDERIHPDSQFGVGA